MIKQTDYQEFLTRCSDTELVLLQHELRTYPIDQPYLDQVLHELSNRCKKPSQKTSQRGENIP